MVIEVVERQIKPNLQTWRDAFDIKLGLKKMKLKLTTIAMVAGFALVFVPIYTVESYNWFWYGLAVVGLILAGLSGMGAQMEMMGQGDTGEEFLREMVAWIKAKFKREKMDDQ